MNIEAGIKKEKMLLIEEGQAAELAEFFQALSDPSRVRIIAALMEREINVSALADIVGLSESAVSHQLRTLRQLRLVRTRRQGRQIYYVLDDAHVVDIFQRSLDHIRHD
ncbi:MAG: ArsR/SmtB family transcription factor [Anaerolineales bacterium]